MSANPYAVQSTEFMSTPMTGDAESTRRKYLNHEVSVKSIGTLYYLGGFFGLMAGVMYAGMGINFATGGTLGPGPAMGEREKTILGMTMAIASVVAFSISILQIWTAYGLKRLKPYSRISGSIIAGIGLLGFPIGTLICAYFLYLLLSAKGDFVFSQQYRDVIQQTPHVKYKTSLIVRICVGLLLFFLLLGLFGLFASMFGGRR
ncbi:hypothetical protein SH501x_005346 [Pirellulaceae bacterium SH501]